MIRIFDIFQCQENYFLILIIHCQCVSWLYTNGTNFISQLSPFCLRFWGYVTLFMLLILSLLSFNLYLRKNFKIVIISILLWNSLDEKWSFCLSITNFLSYSFFYFENNCIAKSLNKNCPVNFLLYVDFLNNVHLWNNWKRKNSFKIQIWRFDFVRGSRDSKVQNGARLLSNRLGTCVWVRWFVGMALSLGRWFAELCVTLEIWFHFSITYFLFHAILMWLSVQV